jgi:glycosyltransferase involved in cell wall biosynthesis
MRVLFAADPYPFLSGTHIENEISAAAAAGVDVHIWSGKAKNDALYPVSFPLHTDQPIAACIEAVQPDLVHSFYLDTGLALAEAIEVSGRPHVCRAHGCEYSPALAAKLASFPSVARIVVFPHVMAAIPPASRGEFAALPATYDAALYRFAGEKETRLVFRAAAALRHKNLEYFFTAAALCPDHRFVLALACGASYNHEAAGHFRALNERTGKRVEILINIDWPTAAGWMRRAGLYMYTPPTHAPGMPVSVAEALGSGCHVVAPDIDGMRDYLGEGGGVLYRTPEEAAAAIRATAEWSPARWQEAGRRASAYAGSRYARARVIQDFIAIWQQAIAQHRRPGTFRRAWHRLMRASGGAVGPTRLGAGEAALRFRSRT